MTTIQKRQLYGTLVCTIGALFYCYEFILRIIPGVLQTELSAAFGHIPAALFGQISALYYLAYSPMQLPVGMLMDRFGPRKLLSLACLSCVIGSWMFSYSSSLFIVGMGRFIIGFGSSFAFVGVLSLALHWLPQKYFSLVAGLVTTLGMLGLVYGEFEITAMASVLGLKSVLMAVTLAGAILMLIIVLVVRDGTSFATQPSKVQPLKVFFKDVLRILISLDIWLIGVMGICLYTSLSVFGELWGQTYLEQAHHLTKLQAASAMSAMFLGWAVGAPLSGYVSDLCKNRLIPLVVGAVMALVCIVLILYCGHMSHVMLSALLFLYGVFSASEIIVFIMAKEWCAVQLSGTVFAVVNMIVTLGGMIYQPLIGMLLDTCGGRQLIDGKYVYPYTSYQYALSILPLSLLLVLVVAFILQRKKKKAL